MRIPGTRTLGYVVLLGLAALLIATIAVVPALASRGDTTVVVGSTSLAANDGIAAFTGQDIPVFQGDASGGYVTGSPSRGLIVSWSFRSAGIRTGDRFVLRVLSPQDGNGQSWRVVATSDPVAVTSATGTDAKLGPFPVTIAIQKGERIALQPLDESYTPIEQGVQGKDGIRYFSGPLADGSSGTIAPGSEADNGQVVPIQATVQVSGGQPSLSNTAAPTISGTPAVGSTLTCSTGSWSQTPNSFAYAWLRDGAPIPGATTAIHTAVAADATHALTCKVTATAGGASAVATSAAVDIPAPALANTALPRVVGTVKAGSPVRCDPGTWNGDVTFKYTWFWQKTVPFPVFRLRLGSRLFGATKGKYYRTPIRRTVVARARIATGATLAVPNLPSSGDLTCSVTASSGPPTVPEVVIAHARAVPVQATLPALTRGRDRKLHPPAITPNVGDGSTNTCRPGIWSGYPTFAYDWYKLGPKPAQRLRPRPRTLIWKGSTIKLGGFHEGLAIECVVTATNRAGSVAVGSNSYVVPAEPLRATSGIFVSVTTEAPSGRGGLVGPEGASVVAERIHLKCIPPSWDGSGSITQQVAWYGSNSAGSPNGSHVPGDSLDLDMSPGKPTVQGIVSCTATATSSRGASATVQSGPIAIWNGCVISNLDSPNSSSLDIGYELGVTAGTAALIATGGAAFAFGFTDVGEGGVGLGFGWDSKKPTLNTTGPNCLDYQKYYEKQGYTVKQKDG